VSSRSPQVAARSAIPTYAAAALAVGAGVWAFAPLERAATPRDVAEEFLAKHAPQALGASVGSGAAARGLFEDATARAGVAFVHDNAQRGEFRIPEQMGPGVGWLDLDSDGDLDLFVAGGGAFAEEGAAQTCRLWRNEGGRFVDATEESGAGVRGHAFGVAVADWDDDGDEDLAVSRLGSTVLLRNDSGRLVDVSEGAGVRDSSFGSSLCFFDYDRDGALDLYVGHYMDWRTGVDPKCNASSGARDYCDPTRYQLFANNVLYRNLGGGRFDDVSERAGIRGAPNQTLGVLAQDFDGDGWVDLYVAEDSVPAKLFMNQRDGTFRESALAAGCAFDARGQAIAGMGVACEDIDGDGQFDLLVSNIRGQSHLALLNGGGRFRDSSTRLGIARWSMGPTGFGLVLFDADLDGELDGYVANGAVAAPAQTTPGASPYAERDQFFGWDGEKFVDRTAEAGFVGALVGRGLALADFDEDGDLDLALANNGGALQLLRNGAQGAWLTVDVRTLKGAPALGALVEVRCGERWRRRVVRPQSSYISSHDPRAHFGLGAAARVDEVRVTWPDGARWSKLDVAPRTRLRVSRAEASAASNAGAPR
jgi:hypothetical protein